MGAVWQLGKLRFCLCQWNWTKRCSFFPEWAGYRGWWVAGQPHGAWRGGDGYQREGRPHGGSENCFCPTQHNVTHHPSIPSQNNCSPRGEHPPPTFNPLQPPPLSSFRNRSTTKEACVDMCDRRVRGQICECGGMWVEVREEEGPSWSALC